MSVLLAGVARFNSISESLTHVIVGSRVEDHWKQVEQLLHKPFVVTTEWVIQSYRLKRAAPETDYLHPEFKVADVDLPRPSESKKTPVKPPLRFFQILTVFMGEFNGGLNLGLIRNLLFEY